MQAAFFYFIVVPFDCFCLTDERWRPVYANKRLFLVYTDSVLYLGGGLILLNYEHYPDSRTIWRIEMPLSTLQ